MSTLSPIQLLPRHVVQLIVKYIAGSNLPLFSGVPEGDTKHMELLLPFLRVCHNFRSVVYSSYCKNLELEFYGGDRVLISWRPWPCRYRESDHAAYHLAREVLVKVDSLAVFNGQARGCLLRAPFNDCPFPLARTLRFLFSLWQLDYAKRVLDALDPAELRANISAFVGRVKQMAPKVNEIRLELVMQLSHPPDIVKKYFGSLVTQLYRLASRVDLSYYHSLAPMELQLHEIRDLVHINSRNYDEKLGYLVRLNASTLQYLTTTFDRGEDFAGVIRDESGDYVQYPHLHTLKLITCVIPVDMRLPIFPGAVPFPTLRHIALDGEYPLGDETIFRGNAATLEFLSLMIPPEKLVLLRERRVFTPTSHPKLRYVRILQPADETQDDIDMLVANKDFVLGIGPNVVLREVTNIPFCTDLPRMLSPNRDRSCLQYLLLYGTSLDLSQVIMLLDELPLLTDLHCGSRGLGLHIAEQPLEDFANFMNSKQGKFGKRFRCWHLDCLVACSEREVALCVLYLALACPNFNHVAPNGNNDDSFKQEMDLLIDSEDLFKPYASRLQRIAFSSDI